MPSGTFRSTLRQHIIKTDRLVRDDLKVEMTKYVDDWRNLQKKVVSSWRNKPTFVGKVKITPTRWTADLQPTGRGARVWRYVDEGTRPHVIRPKKPGGRLAFQTGYSARTAPIARYNVGSGRASGKRIILKKDQAVNHPGTKARKFTVTFAAQLKPAFHVRMQNAIRRGIRRAT